MIASTRVALARTTAQRRRWIAVALALAVHVAALSVIALTYPRFKAPPMDQTPDMVLQLERRPVEPLLSVPPTSGAAPTAGAAPGGPTTLSPSPQPSLPATGEAPPSEIAGANGPPPGCSPEDLILLTEQEKAHCKEAMDILQARRTAAAAHAAEQARLATMRQAPKIDPIDPEKRVEYDTAVASSAATRGNFETFASGAGGKGLHCTAAGRGRYVPPGSTRIGPFVCAP